MSPCSTMTALIFSGEAARGLRKRCEDEIARGGTSAHWWRGVKNNLEEFEFYRNCAVVSAVSLVVLLAVGPQDPIVNLAGPFVLTVALGWGIVEAGKRGKLLSEGLRGRLRITWSGTDEVTETDERGILPAGGVRTGSERSYGSAGAAASEGAPSGGAVLGGTGASV